MQQRRPSPPNPFNQLADRPIRFTALPSEGDDGGGRAATGDERQALLDRQAQLERPTPFTSILTAPRDELPPPSVHAVQVQVPTGAAETGADAALHGGVDYDHLRRRDIAREVLRARLIELAEQRERRSAYEIAFIMLTAAIAVLLAAPPMIQVLLAVRGIEA